MILMQKNFETIDTLQGIKYLVGSPAVISKMRNDTPSKEPFNPEIIDFLGFLSKELVRRREAKAYPDVVTLGFWLRKAHLRQLENQYGFGDSCIHMGRGIAFHIAPSNVPVNFAYSLVSGLLAGNSNIVRVPSKDFPQVKVVADAINTALEKYEGIRPYIVLIRYGRQKEINDFFSSMADTRIIWGGDQTIEQIRYSPLPPRSNEITFADRFSLAVINSDVYMMTEDKEKLASDFYNDTYLSDQNACTSPGLVVWTGNRKESAKKLFWSELHKLVVNKYEFQPIMAVNKLSKAYTLFAVDSSYECAGCDDNLINRVKVKHLSSDLINFHDNCGFFFEYDTDNLADLADLCQDNRVQTVAVLGEKDRLVSLILSGIKGIDRITDIGHTMDFDLVWDGMNLMERLSRTIRGVQCNEVGVSQDNHNRQSSENVYEKVNGAVN